jgi:hypothetical protein
MFWICTVLAQPVHISVLPSRVTFPCPFNILHSLASLGGLSFGSHIYLILVIAIVGFLRILSVLFCVNLTRLFLYSAVPVNMNWNFSDSISCVFNGFDPKESKENVNVVVVAWAWNIAIMAKRSRIDSFFIFNVFGCRLIMFCHVGCTAGRFFYKNKD